MTDDLVLLGAFLVAWLVCIVVVFDRGADADPGVASKFWTFALIAVAVGGLVGISGWAASRPDLNQPRTVSVDCGPQ